MVKADLNSYKNDPKLDIFNILGGSLNDGDKYKHSHPVEAWKQKCQEVTRNFNKIACKLPN